MKIIRFFLFDDERLQNIGPSQPSVAALALSCHRSNSDALSLFAPLAREE